MSFYLTFSIIYTDGSVAASHKFKLNTFSCVFTAEKFEIYEALEQAEEHRSPTRVMICSDSLSVLHSLQDLYSTDALIRKIQRRIHRLLTRRYQVVICWVPGQAGVPGNEAVDRAAKKATEHPGTDIREVPTPDIKNNIKKRIAESWQSEWDIYSFKLKAIKYTVHPWNTSSRRD
jgi:ribonuclease HI